jgi:predicted nucleic acid-binding protein
MMMVDTTAVAAFLRGTPREVVDFVRGQIAGEGLAMSYVTMFELRRGMEQLARGRDGRKLVGRIIDATSIYFD